jgi:hypothetical protein
MTTLDQIVIKIIREQELVIGPLAWSEAAKVRGIQIINKNSGEIIFTTNNPKEAVDLLVNQYEKLFGRASHEVCREAVANLIADLSPEEVPASLRV